MNEMIGKFVEALFNDDPEAIDMLKAVSENIGAKAPAFVDAFVTVIGPAVEHEGLAKMRAKGARTLFNAYLEVGFTEEQALALLVNTKEGFSRALSQSFSNAGSQAGSQAGRS